MSSGDMTANQQAKGDSGDLTSPPYPSIAKEGQWSERASLSAREHGTWRELLALLRRPRVALAHIRVRLTLWYVLILAITLCAAGAAFYTFVANQVNSRLQTELATQAPLLADNARVGFDLRGRIVVLLPSYVVGSNGISPVFAILFGANGQAIAATPTELASLQLPPQVTDQVLDQQPVFWKTRDTAGQAFEFYVFTPARTDLPAPILAVGQPLTDEEHTLTMLAFSLITGIPVALIIATLGGFWLATRALRPVDELTRTAEAISAGDLSRRVSTPRAPLTGPFRVRGRRRRAPPDQAGLSPVPAAAPNGAAGPSTAGATGDTSLASERGVPVDEAGPPNDELGRLASAFNAMLARLQAAFEQQRRFTADASHELRTPLAAILAQTSVTLRRRRAPEDYERALRNIQSETERLSRLVEGLLTLARLDARAPVAIVREPVDLRALTEEACERYEALALERGVTLELDRPAIHAPIITLGDRDQLQQVVSNVLDNALKFTPAGGRVQVHVFAQGKAAIIAVHDTGRGVAPDELAHLTERFYQGDAARTAGHGSGLGLAICQAIVAAHGGTLSIASPGIGQGTLVRIALPMGQ